MTIGRVLIVGDDILASGLKVQFERWGSFQVRIAETYDSALDQAVLFVPTLVIIDLHVKGNKNGFETAIYLNHQHGVPIIFVTTLGEAENKQQPRPKEFRQINKPCHKLELKLAVESLLAINLPC